MSKQKAEIYVTLALIVLWVVGLMVAIWDGDEIVRVVTPLVTIAVGWLFASKVAG